MAVMHQTLQRWRTGDRLPVRAIVTPPLVSAALLASAWHITGLQADEVVTVWLSFILLMLYFVYGVGWVGFRRETILSGGEVLVTRQYGHTYFSARGASELIGIAETTTAGHPLTARPHEGPPIFMRLIYTGTTRNPVPDHRARSLIREGHPDTREQRTGYAATACFLLLDADLSATQQRDIVDYCVRYLDLSRDAGDEGVFSSGVQWVTVQILNAIIAQSPAAYSPELADKVRRAAFLAALEGNPTRSAMAGTRSPWV